MLRKRIFSVPLALSFTATIFCNVALLVCCRAVLMAFTASSMVRPVRAEASFWRLIVLDCAAPLESLAVMVML